MTEYDAIVIGAGQAGPSLARLHAGEGKRVAIIECDLFGGTCVNTGCTPTKVLVASASAAHIARRSAEYGVTIAGPVGIDVKQVKARKDSIVGASRTGVEASLRRSGNIAVIRGHARFVSANEVAVGSQTLRAPSIFINVSARPAEPAITGLETVPYPTNSTILDLDVVPEHLVVIGGSYVGLEFALIFCGFGCAVTVIEASPRLIRIQGVNGEGSAVVLEGRHQFAML